MNSVRWMATLSVLFSFLCIGTYLVAAPYAIAPFFSSIVTIALPVIFLVWLYRAFKASWRVFAVGMLGFAVAQLLHLPFVNWTLLPLLESFGFYADPQGEVGQLLLFGAIVGLSAGIFAETTRYIIYSRFLEKARDWADGLSLGAGFGGAEAVVVGIFALLNLLQALTIKNGDMSSLSPQELAGAQAFSATYWNTSWYLFLLPLIKQVSTILLHMGGSVLVLLAITRQKISWFYFAILLHAFFSAIRLYAVTNWGELLAEGLLLTLSLVVIGYVFQFRDVWSGAKTK